MAPMTRSRSKKEKCEVVTEDDRISYLPNSIIHQILSLLPTDSAVRTCTLSKKWNHLWTGITSLHFTNLDHLPTSDTNALKFTNFIQETLLRRENITVNKFYISCNHHLDASCINAWITYALDHHVSHIFLRVPCNVGDDYLVLPCEMLNCESLTVLVGQSLDYSSELELALVYFSHEILDHSWSRLRVLELTHIQITFDDAVNQVNFRLPVLKKLDLVDCFWFNVKTVSFDAPILESFAFQLLDVYEKIKDPRIWNSDVPRLKPGVEIKVDAPNLRFLNVAIDFSYKLSLCNVLSLCEASFHAYSYIYDTEVKQHVGDLFEAISSVMVLKLTDFAIYELSSANITKSLLSLTQLTFLTINVADSYLDGEILTDLFHYLPCVERLRFNGGVYIVPDSYIYPENYGWKLEPLSQPILPKLESVEIAKFVADENGLGLVKLLLMHARALQKISISMDSEDPEERLQISNQLQMLSRGLTCSVEITYLYYETTNFWEARS